MALVRLAAISPLNWQLPGTTCASSRAAIISKAIQKRGLILRIGGREKVAQVAADENPQRFGFQDVVVCALKAHQANSSAPDFAPLLGPSTSVLTAMNGIPWWYFYANGGPFEGHHLQSVDPAGRQWQFIGPQRAIGCVVEPACEVWNPASSCIISFNRLIIGEP